MNRQQINYIKECLAIRKRRLESQFCPYPERPQEVIDAEALIDRWRRDSAEQRNRIQNRIRDKIQQVEEQLILGSMDGSLADALAALDDWTPEEGAWL